MILEFDLGNSSAKWRALQGAQTVAQGRFDYTGIFLDGLDAGRVAAARAVSVAARDADLALAAHIQRQFGVHLQFVEVGAAAAGVVNSYREPERMGADRWSAIAAAHRLSDGGAVVIDAGTALKIDLVAADGRHLGGYIGAGLGMMRNALLENTQRVRFAPEEDVGGGIQPGDSTATCVGSGTLLALCGSVSLALAEARRHFAGDAFRVFLCGGDAPLLEGVLAGEAGLSWQLHPDLVLDGLACLLPCHPVSNS